MAKSLWDMAARCRDSTYCVAWKGKPQSPVSRFERSCGDELRRAKCLRLRTPCGRTGIQLKLLRGQRANVAGSLTAL